MVSRTSREILGWLSSMLLLLLVSTMLLQQVELVSAGCANIRTTLKSCQAAVEGDSPPPPTEECCNILKDSVGCLCEAIADGFLKDINKQAASMLPSKCKIAIPPGFNCAVVLGRIGFALLKRGISLLLLGDQS